jgi:hypothetical protein
VVTTRVRPRTILAWSAIFALAACNGIWGINDGTLMQPDSSLAGQGGGEPSGALPGGAGAGTTASDGGDGGRSAGGVGGAVAGASGDAAGGEVSSGGVSGGGSGGTGGGAGSLSGSGGGGTGPSCSGCKLNDKKDESRACGRCGTGSQTHFAICDANCTWGPWSDWTTCSQCDTKNYHCCGTGKWEWCYDSDCAWTNECAGCSASSCPECYD